MMGGMQASPRYERQRGFKDDLEGRSYLPVLLCILLVLISQAFRVLDVPPLLDPAEISEQASLRR